MTDNQPSLQIGALALDPTNPDIIYAGTAVSNISFANMGAGILKSTDGGTTWTQLAGPLSTGPGLEASIWSLAVCPSDGNVLLAVDQSATGAAVYRSADGGNTWKQVVASSTAFAGQVLFDPSDGSVAYATLGGVYKSTDGGNTWTTANGTGSNALPAGGYFAMAIASSSPDTLFVGSVNSTGTQMFKTVDGGQNWTPLSGSPWCWDAVVDPVNANIVFAGAAGLERSTDGGLTWTFLNVEGGSYHGGIAFSGDGSRLYLGGEWGVWATSDMTSPTWAETDLNAPLAISLFTGISIHPTEPMVSVGGTQSTGVDLYSGTLEWHWVACDDGGTDDVFDFMSPATIYITCASPPGIQKSTDGGSTFSSSPNGIPSSEFMPGSAPALVMDPSDPQRLYLAGAHVWETSDGANSWTEISPALGPGDGFTQTLAIASSDPNTVYLGNTNGVYVTTNAKAGSGATWSDISTGLPSNVSRIAADPSSAGTAYAVFEGYGTGHVYKTTNRGGTWTNISGNLPNLKVNDIVVDPDVPNTLYIATEQGVYLTSDGGSTWSPLGAGLPNVAVTALKLHRPSRILRAATYGRSVWDLQLGAVSSPVVLSPTSLSFGTQAGSQTVTLTNDGTAPLTLYSIAAPSGFAQSNTCGIQVPSKGNCNITVTFAPPAADTYSGNVTITDDAPGMPQLVAVTGTGSGVQDFSVVSNSPSATVRPGQTASYTLSVMPEGGFNHAISFACSGAPSEATCSVSPSSVTLDGTDTQSATVKVTTTSPSLAPPGLRDWPPSARWPFALWPGLLGLLGVVAAAWLRSRGEAGTGPALPSWLRGHAGSNVSSMFSRGLLLSVMVLLGMALCGSCGGGGGGAGGGSGASNPGTPAGTYTLTVTGTYTSGSTTLTHDVKLTLTVN